MSLKSSRPVRRSLAALVLLSVVGIAMAPQAAQAQSYPNKPIIVVVPFGAGAICHLISNRRQPGSSGEPVGDKWPSP